MTSYGLTELEKNGPYPAMLCLIVIMNINKYLSVNIFLFFLLLLGLHLDCLCQCLKRLFKTIKIPKLAIILCKLLLYISFYKKRYLDIKHFRYSLFITLPLAMSLIKLPIGVLGVIACRCLCVLARVRACVRVWEWRRVCINLFSYYFPLVKFFVTMILQNIQIGSYVYLEIC